MKIIKKFSASINCFCLLFFSCISYGQTCPDSLSDLHQSKEQRPAVILFNQAENLSRGRGVVRNSKRAILLYKQAAKLGHYEAQQIMASMYRNGEGVKRNLRLYKFWQEKSVISFLKLQQR